MSVPLWRWIAVTVTFCLLVFGAWGVGIYAYLNPTVVHKAQLAKAVSAAVGSADVVKIAEKQVESDATANGVTVTNFKVVSVTRHADAVTVRLRVQTAEIGPLTLDVTLSKSVYTVQSVKRTG